MLLSLGHDLPRTRARTRPPPPPRLPCLPAFPFRSLAELLVPERQRLMEQAVYSPVLRHYDLILNYEVRACVRGGRAGMRCCASVCAFVCVDVTGLCACLHLCLPVRAPVRTNDACQRCTLICKKHRR